MLDAAIAYAAERRSDSVSTLHLLYMLTRNDGGVVSRLIEEFGGSLPPLREALLKGL